MEVLLNHTTREKMSCSLRHDGMVGTQTHDLTRNLYININSRIDQRFALKLINVPGAHMNSKFSKCKVTLKLYYDILHVQYRAQKAFDAVLGDL